MRDTRILISSIAISLVLMGVNESSFAMMPVIDVGVIAKTSAMIKQLSDQYETMKQQYTTMQNQYSAVTGNYGFGNWHNAANDLQGREFNAPSWQAALKGEAGGNPARYQQLLAQYKKNHATMNQSDYAKGASKTAATNYSNQVKTNQVSATTATYEFNDLNKHLKSLQELGKQIENAATNKDTKSAIDLNSRIVLEVGYIQVEEVRMATILNQQMAQASATQISQENAASQFNQAGEKP